MSELGEGDWVNATEITFNPRIHNALWHSDNQFVLEIYSKLQQKKCRGCASVFINDVPYKVCNTT